MALLAEEAKARLGRVQPADTDCLQGIENDETRLSLAFDRAWAQRIMPEAAARQKERAAADGPAAAERVELLRLRFEEDLPICTIAERWGRDPATLHREYAKAREEFRQALLDVIAFHHPGDAARAREECEHLLAILA